MLSERPQHAAESPLIAPDLVILASDCRSKEEVIREMTDALQLAGRTAQPEAVEAAVWEREDAVSTGFGDGFALPHCQSDALSATSMVVLRLREPVPWQSLDGLPVGLAVMLALRAADRGHVHLAAMAKLSRLLTRETFRERLRSETDPAELAEFIAAGIRPEEAP
jgi:fructose-specific PTS system IIA-like component